MDRARARRTSRLLLLGVSVAASVGVGEWLYRGLARANHRQQVAAFRSPLFELVPEPWLYSLRADLDTTVTIDNPAGAPTVARYRTNADRLRRPSPWPLPPDANGTRVLFVGDSYTFGQCLQDGEAFPHLVERLLGDRHVAVTAFNAGVPGYDSEQEQTLLAALLPRYRPRLVVVGYVMNDAEPMTTVPLPPELVYRQASSWLLEDGKLLLDALAALLVDDRPLLRSTKPQYDFDYRAAYAPDSSKWPTARAALLAMRDDCRRHGADLLVAVLPDFTKALDDGYPLVGIHDRLVALGEQAGFAVVDLLPALRGADFRALQVPGDGHPNAEGHRRLAAPIADRVEELLKRG